MEKEVTLQDLINEYESIPCPPSLSEILAKLNQDFRENFVGTVAQLEEKKKDIDKQARDIYYKEKEKYRDMRSEKEDKIKDYMFQKSSTTDKDIFEKLYAFAYEEGQDGGFQEIYHYLSDIDDLVDDCLEVYKSKNKNS